MPSKSSPTSSVTLHSTPEKTEERRPRILVVTPEITYLPAGMGNLAQRLHAKAGGLADVSASLVKALHEQGADVHVALPDYRKLFQLDIHSVMGNEFERVSRSLPEQHIHLAEDRIFYHQSSVYNPEDNHLISLAFQREIINHIIPQVRPDLIHCNDWMTGLIPAVARRHGIPCLFTVHNIHTERLTMATIEDRGIDAVDFWEHLFFTEPPQHYEHTREHIPVDFLASGIFAADHVNCVSRTFLHEVIDGRHEFVPNHIRHELWSKAHAQCASGILNAPDDSYNPATDPYLEDHYDADSVVEGKAKNKRRLQEELGLGIDPDAPIFFWPSRLDPVQKGCGLLSDILYETVAAHADSNLQIAIVANGAYQQIFRDIVDFHGLHKNVAVADFNERQSRLGYAASDFMLMPSSFEPCGLPQMVSPKYGTLSVAHHTGGIRDTVEHLDPFRNTGNGFVYENQDGFALRWAIDEAMHFHKRPQEEKTAQLSRIMRESAERFNHNTTAAAYIDRYEKMLNRKVTQK